MNGGEVVVVEDDSSVARLIERVLQREGLHVTVAGTIAAARASLGGTWDLLMLDRRLPDGDGIELCREIRPRNPHAYIMIITGESTQEAKLAGFGCGADDYVTKPFALDELLARVHAGLRIVALQKALLETNARLEALSRTDPLTGVANRRAFEEELPLRFGHARRYSRPLSLVMIDLDRFKAINDNYGHPVGDDALRRVGRLLQRLTRATDFAARYGGEEFAVLLPETQLLEALQFAEKIRCAVASDTTPPALTVSIGIASMAHTAFRDCLELVSAADAALYRAKRNGRNRIEYERRTAVRALENRVHYES